MAVLVIAAVLVAACDERDLSITITAEYDSLEPGARITYTITITAVNTDGSKSTDVEATPSPDTTFVTGPSSSEWNEEVGILRTDESFSLDDADDPPTKVLTLVVRVNKPLTTAITLDAKLVDIETTSDGVRTIAVRNDEDDTNNEASLTIEILDVGVTTEIISGDPSDPKPGDVIAYQHTVTNHLTGSVETLLNNPEPPGTAFFSDESDTNWGCGSLFGARICMRPFPLSSVEAVLSDLRDRICRVASLTMR